MKYNYMIKKYIFLLLLVLSVAADGQTRSYKGFYHSKFINVFGTEKIIEADFEVRENNLIVGKLMIDSEIKILEGQVESKGKFEVQTAPENGVTTLIKGEMPGRSEGEEKASLIRRTGKKGGKNSSKTGISGFKKKVPAPAVLKDAGIVDNGKTQ